MKLNYYLVVSKSGTVRAVKNKPNLGFDEIAIYHNLELPDALFKKPTLEATIMIPEYAALPQIIEADVVENVKDAIANATGLEVRISLESPSEE